ncbi:hypothetical protein DAH62_00715 [Sphingomonas koreensis]|nr:hypothetical protein DAH62_00715 [Sphingomonas koreensis]
MKAACPEATPIRTFALLSLSRLREGLGRVFLFVSIQPLGSRPQRRQKKKTLTPALSRQREREKKRTAASHPISDIRP